MIDIDRLDQEYNDYKYIMNLYSRYKKEFEKFNEKNSKELSYLLSTYNSIKGIKRNESKQDKEIEELLNEFIDKNPLFKKWYKLASTVKSYRRELQQYFFDTHTFTEFGRYICLKHEKDDGYDLFDLITYGRLDLSQYGKCKQQYIINNLKAHDSFICYATQEDLPLLMQILKEIDKEIVYNDNDTEEEMEQKYLDEITRCYTIATEFENRKKSKIFNQINNIEHEKKLIKLLGYNLVGPDKSNRWLIIDDDSNQVGFIQYKKLFNGNVKKGYPKTYGYHMEIDSKDINCNATRKIDFDSKFNYKLDIKREDGNMDHIDINFGDYPNLTLWSKEYGFMDFKIDYRGLYLNFKSKTENFNTEEVLVYNTDGDKVSNHPKEYSYQLRYCDKSIELNDENLKGIKIREITGKSDLYQQHYNEMKLVENTWINGKLRTNRENIVAGTVEEMVVKHGMGIDAFKHFRFLINQILPFKQEVISVMLENYLCKREELSLFVPELKQGEIERDAILVNKMEY